VAWREEISHPALGAPEIATGIFRSTPGGRLIREQRTPREETASIGERFISRDTGEEVELLPITEDLAPFVATLRAMMAGGVGQLSERFTLALSTSSEGWRVALTPPDGEAARALAILGCGERVRGLEIGGPGGEVRRILIGPAR